MPKTRPAEAKLRTLQVFHSLCKRLGRAPTIEETSNALGLPSARGAQHMLSKLVDEGLILATTQTIRRFRRLSASGKRWLEQARGKTPNGK